MLRENKGMLWILIILAAVAVLLWNINIAKAAPYENFNDGTRWTEQPVIVLSDYPVQPCRLTGEQINEILSGTGLAGLGDTYAAGEAKTGINALFIIAITAHESGWGTSYCARIRNNLGGIKGNDGYRTFESQAASILNMYDFLNRLYIQKGMTTVDEIGRKYCETSGWSGQVKSIMRDLIKKAAEY